MRIRKFAGKKLKKFEINFRNVLKKKTRKCLCLRSQKSVRENVEVLRLLS